MMLAERIKNLECNCLGGIGAAEDDRTSTKSATGHARTDNRPGRTTLDGARRIHDGVKLRARHFVQVAK